MRWIWVTLIVGLVVSVWFGMASAVPVAVNAREVREEIESVQAANPSLSLDEAVQQATTHLAMAQKRRVKFLFLAYLVIWAGLLGYLFSLSRRTAHLRAEIERLKERVGH